jgi:hypothetical protein
MEELGREGLVAVGCPCRTLAQHDIIFDIWLAICIVYYHD